MGNIKIIIVCVLTGLILMAMAMAIKWIPIGLVVLALIAAVPFVEVG